MIASPVISLPGTAGQIAITSSTSALTSSADLTWSASTGLLSRKGISSKGAANGTGTELFGLGASDASTQSTSNNTVIGAGAGVTPSYATDSVVIGGGATLSHTLSVLIGALSTANAGTTVTVGGSLTNSATASVLIGLSSSTSAGSLICIGQQCAAQHLNSGAMGWGTATERNGQLVWGQRQTASAAPSFLMNGCSATQYIGADTFEVRTEYIDATLATFKSRAKFLTFDASGEREYMRADATGSGVTVGMLGADVYIGATDPGGTDPLRVNGLITINSATMIRTKTAFTNGAAANAGTLLNAPAAGNPTKWIPIDDNGTTRYIPAW